MADRVAFVIHLEVHGLCAGAQGAPPVRIPNGVHRDRLSLILAVLSKHTSVKPFSVNVHTNVVGGMTMKCGFSSD